MSKRNERLREQKPFESRRTNRVSMVTPRNQTPTVDAAVPAPPEKDAEEPVLVPPES